MSKRNTRKAVKLMRDRLEELILNAERDFANSGKPVLDIEKYVADHLLANGVIVPPCKVGETVWFIRNGKIIETKVDKIVLKYRGLYIKLDCNSMYETSCNSIGKTVFLTKEEAEKALRKEDEGI